jgi:HEPN domain-containing protein
MPPDAGSPAAWLRFARSDLALASQPSGPEVLLEALCFHAQQAAEKAIKSVLLHYGIPAPKLHSIERLLDLLPPSVQRPGMLTQAASLTDYAVISRSPVDDDPVTQNEYREAVDAAAAVVAWAEGVVGKRQ